MNEMDMLRSARPEAPAPDDAVLDQARDRLLAQARDGQLQTRDRSQATIGGRPRTGRRVAAVMSLAAAMAVGATVVEVVSGDDGPARTPEANAATTLHDASRVTLREVLARLRPEQWLYTETRMQGVPGEGIEWMPGEDGDTPRPTTSMHIQTWASARGTAKPTNGHWQRADFTHVYMRINGKDDNRQALPLSPGEWDGDDQNFLRTLPTEPGALLQRVRQEADRRARHPGLRTLQRRVRQESDHRGHQPDAEFDRDQEAFNLVTDLMNGYLTPALRAALYEVLARLPGVTMDRQATDLAGRRGVGFGRSDGSSRVQIIVDARTYRYLGDKAVAVKDLSPGVRKGTVLRWSTQLRAAIVDRPHQQP
ncbi:CU044_5270 family protein [Actinomadura rubrisoli]|uniref:CU044_5270 family protein n=1 Tax=Actinomadura rubrisoli TaxID=2530368 RepID=A0A4R5BDN1_9ACTN|nr:CU044_5270 family protein [Actinomadura rubrisoli]TDD81894.1 hypothetical protein E1298_23450 [Actinomadura rubrisoli]